jgi:hypothetical protein
MKKHWENPYLYQFELGDNEPWNSLTDYSDLGMNSDLLLDMTGTLAIRRFDGQDMSEDEIQKFRQDFFDDNTSEYSDLEEFYYRVTSLLSVYKDKTLFFWKSGNYLYRELEEIRSKVVDDIELNSDTTDQEKCMSEKESIDEEIDKRIRKELEEEFFGHCGSNDDNADGIDLQGLFQKIPPS